jgi:hypothetical protein
MLYSQNGAYPAPLPFRVRLSNGQTRTNPESFTPSEIAAWGFVAVSAPPSFDPNTEALSWTGSAWSVTARSVADRKTEMKSALRSEFAARKAAGKTITIDSTDIAFATDDSAHQQLKALSDRLASEGGTQKAVTRSGARINVTAAQAAAVFSAIDDYQAACWTREYDLDAAIDAAADHAALDAIDVTAGWPE